MTSRGALQMWANHLVDDLRDLDAGKPVATSSCRRRFEWLRDFALQVRRGGDPWQASEALSTSSDLAPSQRIAELDADQQSYALLVWLASTDAVVFKEGPTAWARKVQTVAEAVLAEDCKQIPPAWEAFTRESIKPFLTRVERLDEAPDEDFVALALKRFIPPADSGDGS